MTTLRRKGHRLEVIAVRGGLIASCTCESPDAIYEHPKTVTGVWGSWERPKISAAHQAHLASLPTSGVATKTEA